MDGPDGTLGWRRAAGHSFTADFNDWSTAHAQYVMTPDEEDAPPLSRLGDQSDSRVPSDLHGVAVHYHATSRLYIGRLMVLYTSTEQGGAEVLQQELVTSYDGLNFDRPFRTARGSVCHYTIQPLAELYEGCMVVLKVSWCGIGVFRCAEPEPRCV
jgi:hypothetical protein